MMECVVFGLYRLEVRRTMVLSSSWERHGGASSLCSPDFAFAVSCSCVDFQADGSKAWLHSYAV